MSDLRTTLQERIDELRRLQQEQPTGPWIADDWGIQCPGWPTDLITYQDSTQGAEKLGAFVVAAVNLLPGVLDWAQKVVKLHVPTASGPEGYAPHCLFDATPYWPCRSVKEACAVLGVTP